MENDRVRARILELQAEASSKITLEVGKKNSRLQVLQGQLDRALRLQDQRAQELADVRGGDTGLLVRDWKGKDATKAVYKTDTALMGRILDIMRQAADELGQWVQKQDTEMKVDLVAILEQGQKRAQAAKD
jgi:hypothetical protein